MIKAWLMVHTEVDKIIYLLNFLHPHIHHINHHHTTYQLIFLHYLHPRFNHSNHYHITHWLIFPNHHCYTPLHQLMNVQLVLVRDCSATKRPMTPHSDIKYSIQGERSKIRHATSSLIMEAARIWCLENL